jgi:hypothetical protein
LLITLCGHIYIIFKDKKSKRSHKAVGRNQGFSYYFCLVIEGSGFGAGSGSIPLTNGSGSGSRGTQKHLDLVDPDPDSDPQHWYKSKINIDKTDSKQPKIYRKIHTSLCIVNILRKKSACQKCCDFCKILVIYTKNP